MVYHLSFFLYFYILEELYLMLHIFIIQILGFLEFYLLLLNGNSIYLMRNLHEPYQLVGACRKDNLGPQTFTCLNPEPPEQLNP